MPATRCFVRPNPSPVPPHPSRYPTLLHVTRVMPPARDPYDAIANGCGNTACGRSRSEFQNAPDAAARGTYSGKSRPAVVTQVDPFESTASVTVVPFTTSEVEAPLPRIPVRPRKPPA